MKKIKFFGLALIVLILVGAGFYVYRLKAMAIELNPQTSSGEPATLVRAVSTETEGSALHKFSKLSVNE